ncbi:MAG: hypothetical protein D6702_08495 [Planctomycetota bacterium]|nr:MAG: hypothetical protein D6702_08495 [Planctomycetota bacterium]
MSDARGPRVRGLVLALAAGALPGLAAPWLDARILQPGDLAGAALVLPLVLVLARLVPSTPPRPTGLALGLALVCTAVLGGAAHLRLPTTVTNDEAAILFQADTFASGRLAAPLGHRPYADPVAHCPTHRRQVYEDAERGLRFSKYAPGPALFLAPLRAAGLPAAFGPVLAGLLSVLLLHRLARRYGLAAPDRAALLLATSPFFLLVTSSFQSEAFTLPAALAGFLLLLRLRRSGGRAAAVGLGAVAGWIFLCRPLTGVVFALACLPALLRRGEDGRPAPGPAAVAAAVLGGLPFLAASLCYDHALTGEWLLSPYQLYARDFGPFFPAGHPRAGQPLDVYGNGDPLTGLLRQAGRWSVALFGILGAVALGFWGLWRLRRRDGGAGLALAVLLPFAYAFHWYSGHWAYLGPLYAFESLGLLLIGALVLLEQAPPAWRRALPLAAVVAGPVLFLVRFRLAEDQARERWRPQAAAAAAPADAVVLIPRPPLAVDPGKLFLPDLPPFPADRPVILRELSTPGRTRAALAELGLGDRPVLRFLPGTLPEEDLLQPYEP